MPSQHPTVPSASLHVVGTLPLVEPLLLLLLLLLDEVVAPELDEELLELEHEYPAEGLEVAVPVTQPAGV